jgi:hypothetical protein
VPWDGSSGLPKEVARAVVAVIAAPAADAAANIFRLDIMAFTPESAGGARAYLVVSQLPAAVRRKTGTVPAG